MIRISSVLMSIADQDPEFHPHVVGFQEHRRCKSIDRSVFAKETKSRLLLKETGCWRYLEHKRHLELCVMTCEEPCPSRTGLSSRGY